jgi:hypothetical protein
MPVTISCHFQECIALPGTRMRALCLSRRRTGCPYESVQARLNIPSSFARENAMTVGRPCGQV